MHSILQRKASIFAQQEWRENPWDGSDKGIEQMIFDYGLSLGGLLETADNILEFENCSDDVARLLGELAETVNNIQKLCQQHSSPEMGSSKKSQESPFARSPESHPSHSLRIMAWGLELIACVTGCAITLKAESLKAVTIRSNVLGSGSFDIQTAKEWFNTRRITLAHEICRSSISYLSAGIGIMGASSVIFPLRIAFEQLDISDTEYSECRALLQKLKGKGMGFVPALNRNESIASRIIHRKGFLQVQGE